MLGFKSILGGFLLGCVHLRLYHKMLSSLFDRPANSSFRGLAVGMGAIRFIFTFAAGILLIRVARLDPLHLCGGLLLAVVAYRIRLFTS